jgi:hypothetical protein
MNFRPELADKVMAGEKTVTRRVVSDNRWSPWYVDQCSLKVGRDYAVCPGRGKNAIGRVRIKDVRREPLGHLSDEEARREGFATAADFEAAFRAINGIYADNLLVWRVEFEVMGCICDVRGPDYDDVTVDPACMYHGDAGTMVARLPRQVARV